MALQEHPGHYVRQVTLPDGSTIDVVYFEDQGSHRDGGSKVCDLHVCPGCNSDLVHPLDWQEVEREFWAVELRCPNCQWSGTGVFDEDTVERFDRELDRGLDQLVTDLRRLERANMEEAIDQFAYALAHDHLVPEDF